MTRTSIAIALVALVALTAPLRAGIYDPRNPTSPLVTPDGVRPMPADLFLAELTKLAAVRDTRPVKIDLVPNAPDEQEKLTALANATRMKMPRLAIVKERDQLLSLGRDKLNPTQAAALAAFQWRLGDADAALETLKSLRDRDPNNFWELTLRGSVYQGQRQYRDAASNLESSARYFPSPWPGDQKAGDFFKSVEGYQLKLVRLRERELQLAGGRPVPPTDVDALFDIRLVGPSGRYEAGKVTGRLPPDAIAIVQQLLLWFPDDNRLLWLLAELYNGEGNLEAAATVFDQFGWARGSEGVAMREHRRVIRSAYEAQTKAAPAPAEAPKPPPPEPPKPQILPGTWQVYTVAIIFGVLFLGLAYWQITEWLRRVRGSRSPVE